jgi:hypothetical protein
VAAARHCSQANKEVNFARVWVVTRDQKYQSAVCANAGSRVKTPNMKENAGLNLVLCHAIHATMAIFVLVKIGLHSADSHSSWDFNSVRCRKDPNVAPPAVSAAR